MEEGNTFDCKQGLLTCGPVSPETEIYIEYR